MRSQHTPSWKHFYRALLSTALLFTLAAPVHGQTVIATVPGGCCISGDNYSLAVNPVTNKVYVHNSDLSYFSIIDGATNSSTTVFTPLPLDNGVAVNPTTNRIYWTNPGWGNVLVTDGATNSFLTVTDPNADWPRAVAVNPVTNKIYVAVTRGSYGGESDVTVIDGATNTVTDTVVGAGIGPLAVNSATNRVYVVNGNDLTVIDGATNSAVTVPGAGGGTLAVNAVTNKIYVVNSINNAVIVIDGATNSVATLPGVGGGALAVNPATNKIYVVNGNNLTVIDGDTNSAVTVTGAGGGSLAVNSVTNKIYLADSDKIITVDGSTNSIITATDPNAQGPAIVAVNSVTNRIYVGNSYSANVTVLDGRDEPSALFSPLGYCIGGNPDLLCMAFPSEAVGTASAGQKLLLTTGGVMPVDIASISASGDFAQTNDCPATLGPSTTCTINVTFTSTAAGSRSGTIIVTSNSPFSPQSASLTGSGVAEPVANAGPNQTLECTSYTGTPVTLDGSASNDPNGDQLTYEWKDSAGYVIGNTAIVHLILALGRYAFTLTVSDGKGGTASAPVTVAVRDTTPPDLSVSLSPNVLWPPNHQLRLITASIGVSDACDANPKITLVSITTNEPGAREDIKGANFGTDDRSFLLRAERAGWGRERIYKVRYRATDASGNETLATAPVIVPHDMR